MLSPALFPHALIVVGLSIGLLGVYTLLSRFRNGADFSALLLAASIYGVGYGLELGSASLAEKLFWLKIQYIGISFLPAFWNVMIIKYVGKEQWLNKYVRTALFIIPVITLLLHWTGDYHQLHYGAKELTASGPFLVVSFTKGPWYWVHIAYLDLSLLFGNILLFGCWRRTVSLYRKQIAVIAAASLCPWLGHVIYLTGGSPWGLDLSPFAFFITVLACVWGLYGFQLFDLAPIARAVVLDAIADGIVVMDMQDRIVDFNLSAVRIIQGLSSMEIGRHINGVIQPYPELLNQIAQKSDVQASIKVARQEDNCFYTSRLVSVPNRKGAIIGRIMILHDITQQTLLTEQLRILATIDGLTGIFNRNHFYNLSKREFDGALKRKEAVSLIILDVDYFKEVNDTYGHKAGDIVLKEIAARLSRGLRTTDFLGRYGGEEFVVFLPNTPAATAYQIAERLRDAIAGTEIPVEQESVSVTASFGVAGLNCRNAANDLEELLKKADNALYEAKSAGRNVVVLAQGA